MILFSKNILVRYFQWILKYSKEQQDKNLLKCYYEINQVFGDIFSLLLPLEEHQRDTRINSSQEKFKFQIKNSTKPCLAKIKSVKIEDVFEVPASIKSKKIYIKI